MHRIRISLSSLLLAFLACLLLPCLACADEAGTAMYRLYNPNSGEHFYTASISERNGVVGSGWRYEGVGWYAPTVSDIPVFRLYNPNAGDHHYTTDPDERGSLLALGWRDEGVGWYSDAKGRVPLYRQYNPNAAAGTHNYTTSAHENEQLVRLGWSAEGVGWYGVAEGETLPALAAPSANGALHVRGTQLVDQYGNAVQLRGVSTHGLSWFPQYVNEACFSQLRYGWGANVVRLALYTAEYGGYCSGGNQAQLRDLVCQGAAYAQAMDLYVIVDWHILSDGNPLEHVTEAKDFFAQVSRRLASQQNVLYEICNEPNGGTSWEDVKHYAGQVIPVIRANDPDAVVLVGSPTWSQDIHLAAADPLPFDNVMYTLHFYAATHGEWLRERMSQAIASGLPVFVSEFGICDASGNGAIDEAAANAWLGAMARNNVSWCLWSLCNKDESASVLKGSCQKVSGFEQGDLAQSGRWLLHALAGTNPL